ncbi:MAG: ATP-binding protein [Spirochaetaceae bacterium]|nr:ATP-binding protein [Spirochaetaceae bacterium]
MLKRLSVRTFKSLADVHVELGLVNVFIGANGSGKSNLLEALGVLSAAADGKVDDQSLFARGVRPGVPRLYKSAFPAKPDTRIPPHISFGAQAPAAEYRVTLHNPLNDPAPAWKFKTEYWEDNGGRLVGRSSATKKTTNPERGLAALRAAEVTHGDALDLLKLLQGYAIYCPTTPVLRGVVPESQPRQPVGLSGGYLPRAVLDLLKQRRHDEHSQRICRETLEMVDWAATFGAGPAERIPLSPAAASSDSVIRFRDRFMQKDRNVLSGYDASEGALYALFLAVIAGHEESPSLCAVDNADHGLNPRLARSLMEHLCAWYLEADEPRQILLTTHNPLVLDGLPLQDDRVRLFTVARTGSGRTSVRRVEVTDGLLEKAEQGWSLSRLWVMGHLGGVPDV